MKPICAHTSRTLSLALLVWASGPAGLAQNGPVKLADWTVGSQCSPGTPLPGCVLVDSVAQKTISSGFAIASTGGFYATPGATLTPYALALPAGPATSEFTIAVQFSRPNPARMVLDFQIVDASGRLILAVLRGPGGARYVGKAFDLNSPAGAYLNQIWDPDSPCENGKFTTCDQDTLYIGFRKDGTIRLDELVMGREAGSSELSLDLESGLLNYGYPVDSYRTGGAATPPADLPSFLPAQNILLPGTLSRDTFGVNSTYRPANDISSDVLSRFAVWQGTLSGDDIRTDSGFSGSWSGSTLPCNTGLFQRNSLTDQPPLVTTQYNPGDAYTACAFSGVPMPVRNLSGTPGAGSLTVTWQPPAESGAAVISGYYVAWQGSDSGYVRVTGTSYTISGLTPGSDITVAVAAFNAMGVGVSTSISSTLDAALVPAGPTPPDKSAFWSYCALNSTCTPEFTGIAAYGTSPDFVYRQITANSKLSCKASTFGVSTQKSSDGCFLHPQLKGAGDYVPCSTLNGTCRFSGYAEVRIGNDQYWGTASASSGIECVTSNFTSYNSHGLVPRCYYKPLPSGPSGSAACAFESSASSGNYGTCRPGGVLVAYGAENSTTAQYFVTRSSSSGILCTTTNYSAFSASGDPLPGTSKSCYAFPGSRLPESYVSCAQEGGKCGFTGWAYVAFGAGTDWVIQKRFGGIDCTTAAIGTTPPATQARSCYYSPLTAALPAPATFCAYDGARCPSPAQVNMWWTYGAEMGGTAKYGWLSGWMPDDSGVPCDNRFSGWVDPYPGVGKTCGLTESPGIGKFVTGYQKCANDGDTCVFPGTAYVAYGDFNRDSGRRANMQKLTAPVSCSKGIFGDPEPGQKKYCYWAPAK